MINRCAQKARKIAIRDLERVNGGRKIGDVILRIPTLSYHHAISVKHFIFKKEANIAYNRTLHELKSNNMTKSKYQYLKRQLAKYHPYTSHGSFYCDWFDGDEFTIPSRSIPNPRNSMFIEREALSDMFRNTGAGKAHSLEFINDTESFTERYTCLCGQDVGKAKKGKTCELCNSKVKLIDIEKENELMKEIYGNEYIALSNEDIKKLEEGTHENLTIRDEYLFKKALSTGTKKAYGVHIKLDEYEKLTARYGNSGVVADVLEKTKDNLCEDSLLINRKPIE